MLTTRQNRSLVAFFARSSSKMGSLLPSITVILILSKPTLLQCWVLWLTTITEAIAINTESLQCIASHLRLTLLSLNRLIHQHSEGGTVLFAPRCSLHPSSIKRTSMVHTCQRRPANCIVLRKSKIRSQTPTIAWPYRSFSRPIRQFFSLAAL